MRPIDNLDIQALVCYVAEQVVARFFHTLRILTNREDDDNSAAIEWFANRITTEIWREWNDVTTSDHAEAKLEEMYNAARTMLVRLLNLHGGTVEFGPGDVQPLTDQRIGQTEAWETFCAHMNENNWGEPEGWYFNGEHYADDLEGFLDEYFMKRYVDIHDCEVTLRRANEEVQAWAYTTFSSYYNSLPHDLDSPRQLEYRIDDHDGTEKWYPLPNEFVSQHDNVVSALYERERFRSFHRNIDHRYLRMLPLD